MCEKNITTQITFSNIMLKLSNIQFAGDSVLLCKVRPAVWERDRGEKENLLLCDESSQSQDKLLVITHECVIYVQ